MVILWKGNRYKSKGVLIYHVEPPEELLNKGNYITTTNIEEPEQKQGKTALPYCNPETGVSGTNTVTGL